MKYFGHAQPCLNTPMWHLWIVLLLLQMPTHIQKIYLIPNPISAILLINNFEVLWAYPTMSDQTHLIFKSKCAASMDTCPNTKNQLHTNTNSWDIVDLSYWSTFNIPNHARLHPPGIYKLICFLYGGLPICKKSTSYLNSFVWYWTFRNSAI